MSPMQIQRTDLEVMPLKATQQVADMFKQVADAGGGRLGTQAVAKALESAGGFSFQD